MVARFQNTPCGFPAEINSIPAVFPQQLSFLRNVSACEMMTSLVSLLLKMAAAAAAVPISSHQQLVLLTASKDECCLQCCRLNSLLADNQQCPQCGTVMEEKTYNTAVK